MKDISKDLKDKRSILNGREVVYEQGAWRWSDTKEIVGAELRSCSHCGKLPTREGEDGCLGHLPGVVAACCGHGVEDGYIIFANGVEIEFRLIKPPVYGSAPTLPWRGIRERQAKGEP